LHGREPRHWFEPTESLYRQSGTYDVQNRIIYQDRTTPECKMTSRANLSSELFPLEDAGLIRRNWKVGLRVIFGLFWAADAYLKWASVKEVVDKAAPTAAAESGEAMPPVATTATTATTMTAIVNACACCCWLHVNGFHQSSPDGSLSVVGSSMT